MRPFTFRERVHMSAEEAFDFAVERQPENHPKWEKEVLSARRDGPLRVGARGVMVRKEGGKVTEAPFEIIALVPGRSVRFKSGAGGFHLDLAFAFEPVGNECDLVVNSALTLSGGLRLLWPMFWFLWPRRSARISQSLVSVLNASAAGRSTGHQAAGHPNTAEAVQAGA